MPYCETFGWVNKENLARMKELTYKANDVLKKLFDDAGLIDQARVIKQFFQHVVGFVGQLFHARQVLFVHPAEGFAVGH